MSLRSLSRTSAFRITVLYAALFAASVVTLLSFIYGSTVAVIARQTDQTIEAEVRGLAEQYAREGLGRLVAVIRERSREAAPGGENVYLLTDPLRRPLAGNLEVWPPDAPATDAWIRLELLRETDGSVEPHEIRARTFRLPGGYGLIVGRDRQEEARFRRTVIEAMAWSLTAVIGFGLLGGGLLSQRVLARVDKVAATARRIGAGALTERIAVSGSGDEFDRLAEGLNAMLDRIDRLMTGMRLATDSLAHDLRGPLTRLRGRIELALRAEPDGERDRAALADVLDQAEQALAVFDNLLRIALAESGANLSDLETLDVADIAAGAAELYEPVAEQAGQTLAVALRRPAVVLGHSDLLAQAVANLLDNAVKYTPPGGRILLTVGPDPEAGVVELEVADTGPGIPEAARARVLERFVRLEPSRGGRGAGLGLSLVAAVAKLHEAGLELTDNAPGLRVTLRLPAGGEADAGRVAATAPRD